MFTIERLTKANNVLTDGTIELYRSGTRNLIQFEGWAVLDQHGRVVINPRHKQFEVYPLRETAIRVADALNNP